ncbi:MAG: Nif3-like dinuclear metal center hexameric protein, partial [Saprospiraceae bacterium]|nr:Nif3-like dinuclear metal center hexameric protein [Saprospiraceae bacterium]
MKIRDIIDYLHAIAPNHLQEAYDNSGLLVGDYNDEVKSVLVSLDVTEAVLEESEALGANLIISHHPIIFGGIKRLVDANYVQRIVKQAIQKNINLFAIHTNLDNVLHQGVNERIAQNLGLKDIDVLLPKPDATEEYRVGAGLIGALDEAMDEMAFLNFLKEKMNVNTIKYTQLIGKSVKNIALCGGSGRFLLQEAISRNADVFISSDFKYHEFFDADGKIIIADIGHYE